MQNIFMKSMDAELSKTGLRMFYDLLLWFKSHGELILRTVIPKYKRVLKLATSLKTKKKKNAQEEWEQIIYPLGIDR